MNLYTEETEETEQSQSFAEQEIVETPFVSIKDNDAADSDPDILLEPVTSELYNLSYTCLLIPRFPSHLLKGDLADFLPKWLHQICIAFSYRLEFITVNPNYLQWAIIVPPSTSPTQFMEQICKQTSKMILENFGHIRRGNLSNDFWAEGYLVVLGTRPHSEEMIAQYIQYTRQRQGLNKLF